MRKYYKYLLFLLIGASSCEKLQFDDPVSFTLDEALDITPDYYFKVAAAGFSSTIFYIHEGYNFGNALNLLSDQNTSTNRNNEAWDFAVEPRKVLNNSESYGGAVNISGPYQIFYQSNLDATKAIAGLKAGNKGVDDKGEDRTDEVYAVAHLTKGISQGILGAIYDRGIIVDHDGGINIPQSFPNSYKELIENAVAHIDSAIVFANNAPKITLTDFYVNIDLDKTRFIEFANTFAAKILAALPRDKDEAKALGSDYWNRVLDYANKGLKADFTTTYVNGGFYNYNIYYTLQVTGGGALVSTDIKVAHFADATGEYPYDYPLESSVVLSPVVTNDKRFSQYFRYFSNFGYLREDRGKNLFSNYGRKRYAESSSEFVNTAAGKLHPIVLEEELRLLRSEAKFWLGDIAGAAAEINSSNSARRKKGELGPIDINETSVQHALHYEYTIEIDLAGTILNPFTFLRRHNLLQPGTPTEFPVPERQLKLTDQGTIYTFGGVDNAGQKGIWGETATAGNDWGWKGTKIRY